MERVAQVVRDDRQRLLAGDDPAAQRRVVLALRQLGPERLAHRPQQLDLGGAELARRAGRQDQRAPQRPTGPQRETVKRAPPDRGGGEDPRERVR